MKHEVIGSSDIFLKMLEKTSKLAQISRSILIFGERGTGKELVAERLHFLSSRWDQPFIKINCAALNDNLLESELFGYEQGAFTGATKKQDGKFIRAHGGTIFLDEIATASMGLQEKLLRVIEYGEFERVGGHDVIEVDVRIIAATNLDLRLAAARGSFRLDLLDRLCFDVIVPPPLRDRGGDILDLAFFFGKRMARQLSMDIPILYTKKFIRDLYSYTWPGNIRELKNAVERSVFYHDSSQEYVDDLIIDPFPQEGLMEAKSTRKGAFIYEYKSEISLQNNILDFEKLILTKALNEYNQNQTLSAEKLKITYHQLRNYLKKHELIGGKKMLLGMEKTGETQVSPN